MKYKIEPGCALYNALKELKQKGDTCHQKAMDFLKKYNAEEYTMPVKSLMGGITGIVFIVKPEGWKRLYDNVYAPTVKNKAVLDEMQALPVVEYAEFNALLNFKPFAYTEGRSFKRILTPSINFLENMILVDINSETPSYQPVEGMVEILESVFKELNKKAA